MVNSLFSDQLAQLKTAGFSKLTECLGRWHLQAKIRGQTQRRFLDIDFGKECAVLFCKHGKLYGNGHDAAGSGDQNQARASQK